MISVLLCRPQDAEAEELKKDIRYLTAMYSDEELDLSCFTSAAYLECEPGGARFLHMAILEIIDSADLQAAEKVRFLHPDAQIMIIAGTDVSPAQYLTPDIRPSALLLRPYEDEERYLTLRKFFLFSKGMFSHETRKYCQVKSRSGIQHIPYDSIAYFEAREKRIFVRTGAMEYGMGGTIEKIAETLPASFIRCHRSFIVNKDHIERIRPSEGMLYLLEGISIPVSRSYKQRLTEVLSGNGTL